LGEVPQTNIWILRLYSWPPPPPGLAITLVHFPPSLLSPIYSSRSPDRQCDKPFLIPQIFFLMEPPWFPRRGLLTGESLLPSPKQSSNCSLRGSFFLYFFDCALGSSFCCDSSSFTFVGFVGYPVSQPLSRNAFFSLPQVICLVVSLPSDHSFALSPPLVLLLISREDFFGVWSIPEKPMSLYLSYRPPPPP